MENQSQPPKAAAVVGTRRELSTDPVKAQGILKSVTKKEKDTARLWEQRWKFYSDFPEIQEEEAEKLGMTREEYRAAVRSVSSKPEKILPPVFVEPSSTKLPLTTSGMIGRRVHYPLEKYGRLVKTSRDYPTRPPLPPGQIYDPYKQTMVFLGSVEGDPISYKLSQTRSEVTDDMWAQPMQLQISMFDFDTLFL